MPHHPGKFSCHLHQTTAGLLKGRFLQLDSCNRRGNNPPRCGFSTKDIAIESVVWCYLMLFVDYKIQSVEQLVFGDQICRKRIQHIKNLSTIGLCVFVSGKCIVLTAIHIAIVPTGVTYLRAPSLLALSTFPFCLSHEICQTVSIVIVVAWIMYNTMEASLLGCYKRVHLKSRRICRSMFTFSKTRKDHLKSTNCVDGIIMAFIF